MMNVLEPSDCGATDRAPVSRACEDAAAFLGYRVEKGKGSKASYTVLVDEESGKARTFSSRGALSAVLCLELMEAAGFRDKTQIKNA